MFKFYSVHSITGKFKDIPDGYYPIEIDPSYSMGYDIILICQKEFFSFDEVINCLKECFLKADYLGCYSLIYWKYYKEFYCWIKENLKLDNASSIKTITKFYNRALLRWVDFIKYSDDTLYPQNEYFRLMKREIENYLISSLTKI